MNHQAVLNEIQDMIASMPGVDLPALLGDLERFKALTWRRIMSETCQPHIKTSPSLLTMKDIARELNIPLSCAYDLTRQGKLRSIRVGVNERYVRVRPEDLEHYKTRK